TALDVEAPDGPVLVGRAGNDGEVHLLEEDGMVLVGVLGGRPHGATQAGQHLDGLMSGAAGKEGVFA
ncbi:unnamed protein product, partial [Tilletia laevis]